jgi:hypothetical protein
LTDITIERAAVVFEVKMQQREIALSKRHVTLDAERSSRQTHHRGKM